MKSEYLERWAKVLIDYSLEIKEGDILLIKAPELASPLINEVLREALLRGAHPELRIEIESTRETFFRYAKDEQLSFVSPLREYELEILTKFLHIWGNSNTRFLSGIDPKKIAIHQRARQGIFDKMLRRIGAGEIKWTGTLFPTNALAQEAGMSLQEFEDFVARAGHLTDQDPVEHWKRRSRIQGRIASFLNEFREFRVVAEGTELSLRTDGRKWISADGKENFPDGEVFTSPIEDKTEGVVSFTFPSFHQGREVEGVVLRLKEGSVTEARAEKGMDFLEAILETDEGAKRIGEFAIGLNYSIDRVTKNTLFDEKIGGTVHFAVGASIPQAGGRNKSGIHWDMVVDMKSGGQIYADGELIYRDGKFLMDSVEIERL